MSLSTLLEAAEYLEQQEKELQQIMSTSLPITEPIGISHQNIPPTLTIAPTKNLNLNQNGQTVVISSSNISLQGPLTLSTPIIKKEQDQHVSSTVMSHPRQRMLHNSFDIMNPLVIDEANPHDIKRKIPPMAFRAGTREVHNKLEKHRRAHLKECFDVLKKQLPQNQDEKKTSNLSILHHALRYIQSLKRKERELEHEIERLAREKISNQQRALTLRKELPTPLPPEIAKLLPELVGGSPTSLTLDASKVDSLSTTSVIQQNGSISEKVSIPILAKSTVQQTSLTSIKEVTSSQSTVQTTQLSVLPVSYPVNQGLVLQKVAIVPKGLTDLTPLVQTHFITTQQQLNGKVVPVAQYLVKPVVVVSTASPRPS